MQRKPETREPGQPGPASAYDSIIVLAQRPGAPRTPIQRAGTQDDTAGLRPSVPTTAQVPEIEHSAGRPLPAPLEALAVASFGESMPAVRVHTDDLANRAANRVQARAFTVANDIYFANGAYQPQRADGRELIGHEIAHVLQQRAGLEAGDVHGPGDRYEREAGHAGRSFSGNKPVHSSVTTRPQAIRSSASGRSSSVAQARPLQRDVEGMVKIKGQFKLFTPTIGDSVGAGGANKAADVRTVQILLKDQGYDVEPTGKADDATLTAILDFQKRKFPRWRNHDGKIDVGKSTWKALTHAYYKPDETPRKRKQFAKSRSVLISPADISSAVKNTLAYVEDENKDKLDDYIALNREAAASAGAVDNIKATGIRHVAAILQQYYDMGISIDTLYIASHGSYFRQGFVIGNETVTPKNITRLRILRNLLSPNTKLVVNACHVGGGSNPKAARRFTQKLAQTLGITVYTSRSWSRGSTSQFTDDEPASYFGDPTKYSSKDIKDRPNVYKFLGQWLEATPGEKKATIRVINTPMYRDDGGFDISDTRFPDFNPTELAAYLGVVAGLKAGK
ncbi:MAG: DUF4157 domain-containing protein [Proteobacteria bacterium]|nr:DUF4157 domain-containing protein [Pseudomonadota bacterium]